MGGKQASSSSGVAITINAFSSEAFFGIQSTDTACEFVVLELVV
jgi:hypothetical protein